MKFEWENIYLLRSRSDTAVVETFRAKVIGGWLIKNLTKPPAEAISESMVFIHDPEHKWNIDND